MATPATMITQLVDCTFVMRPDGILESADEGVRTLLGYEPSDVPGQSVWDYLHPDDLDEAVATLARHVAQPGYRDRLLVVRVRHADGSWRQCEVPARGMLVGEHGILWIGLRWVGHVEPASPTALAVDDLTGRAGFDTRFDSLVVADRNARITIVEDRITSLLGHTPSELVDTSLFDHVHPDEQTAARAWFAREAEHPDNREPVPVLRFRHRDGGWRRCEAPARNRLADPRLRGVVLGLRYVGAAAARTTGTVTRAQWGTLTPVEQEIVTAVSSGLANKEIAARRSVKVATIEAQLTGIYRKLGVRNRAQLVAEAHAR